MSNHRFSRFITSALVLWMLVLSGTSAGQPSQKKASQPASPPNLLLITIDTLRPDHLHCYGYQQIQTPSVDSLAIDGLRFEQAYTPIPITLPSHAVMLTGTYPMMSGMHDFSGNNLNPTQPTLATVLRTRGYDTGAVVAAAVLDRRFGLNNGFDFYYDHFDFSRLAETNLDLMERPGNEVVDQALAWLAKPRKGPFFLWVHLYDPHAPYKPPAPFNEKYRSNLYDGEIAFADSQVERLLRYLKEHALYSRTLVALSGDHGEGLGEHGEKTHGFFVYNSTLHVPLIIKPPQGTKFSAKVLTKQVSLVDLMPTLLGLLKTPIPPKVQGKDLASLLIRGADTQVSPLYSETFLPRLHFNWSELRGLHTSNYHFINGPKAELYDNAKDPHELHNLFAEKEAVSSELRAKLTSVIKQYTVDHEMAQKSTLDPELASRLQALGYAAFAGGGDSLVSDPKLPDPKDRIQVYETVSEAIDDSQHGRYQEAIEKLKTTLSTEENSVPIHYLLGLNYYRTKDFPSAVAEFQKTLKLSPDYALAAFHLGLAYARVGQSDDAITTLKRALELDSTNFTAAYDLGLLYLQKNMTDEAVAAFRHSIEVTDAYAPGHRALGEVLLAQGQVDEALVHLRKAAELAPEDAATHAALARALTAKGLTGEAQQQMQKAQESRPQ